MWIRVTSCPRLPALVVVGLLLSLAPGGQPAEAPLAEGVTFKFVNKTDGRFTDEQCYWSLNGGKEWHSFAKEPTVPCPNGNGRVYFRLGTAPKNLDDRSALWDFIEYAYARGIWNGNTTQVDAFCIPMTIELGDKKVGIRESRRKLFTEFRERAPKEFQACVKADAWILSPCRAGFGVGGPNGKYFDRYINQVWEMYAQKKRTPSGKWIGEVIDGGLTFTPVDGGKAIRCARKPTTQESFLGTGVLAGNPQFCAAINRHVLADPADWHNPAAFYKTEPCNWYARFFHEHGIDHKAYGFCYDDVGDQAAFFSGKGREVVITLYWD
jgi:Beta-1,3-glucanase